MNVLSFETWWAKNEASDISWSIFIQVRKCSPARPNTSGAFCPCAPLGSTDSSQSWSNVVCTVNRCPGFSQYFTQNTVCLHYKHEWKCFDVSLTVHLSIFILVINQLDAQHFCFTVSLFHASTCFEHRVLLIRRSSLNLCTGRPPIGVMKPEAV